MEVVSKPRTVRIARCTTRFLNRDGQTSRAVIAIFPWYAFFEAEPEPKPAPKERREPLKLARHYQSLLDTGKFESRAALARHLGVSRARVTQVLRRLDSQ